MSRSFRGQPEPDEQSRFSSGDSMQSPDLESALRSRVSAQGSRGNKQMPENTERSRGIKFSSFNKYGEDEELSVDPTQIDMGKRLVAALIDIFAGYLLGLLVSCIPFVNYFFHDQMILALYLLVRDSLFDGRGVGKNLMGLQVVDIKTGKPASLSQSVKRNIVIYGPYLALYALKAILTIVPGEITHAIFNNAVIGLGTVYTLLVIPYEAYRVYSRVDGLRWGDMIAGTATIPADMDFSNPLPDRR